MKSRFGISIAAGALAVGLAGTALAGEPATHGDDKAQPDSQDYGQPAQPDSEDYGQPAQPDSEDYGQPAQPESYEQGQQYGQGEMESGGASSYLRAVVPAPRNAFEIGVSTGYTQGFGHLENGMRVGAFAGAALGLGLNLSYRVSPMFSIGVASQYQTFNPANELGRDARVRGMSVGLDATFHMAPYRRLDPYVSLGTGYRFMWVMPKGSNNDVLAHGFQLARVNVGLDMRVSKDVAIGPMIGADLNMFAWNDSEGSKGNRQIEDKGVSTFIYTGLQGRFDVAGSREPRR